MRVGLLVDSGDISEFRLKTLKPILEDKRFEVKLAIVDKRKKSFKDKLIKNLKRGRGGYILIMALQRLFSKKEKENSKDLKSFCKENSIEIFETNDPYSAKTLNKIKSYNLDILLLVSGYGIIKEPLLKITPYGILSYHHGNMRKYRGMPPAFWELYNNEKEIGITVQKLSVGLDAGVPIEEKILKIYKEDTLESLNKRLRDESVDMMYKALVKVYKGDYEDKELDELGKVYTLPNLREWITFKIKMLIRKLK